MDGTIAMTFHVKHMNNSGHGFSWKKNPDTLLSNKIRYNKNFLFINYVIKGITV